MLFYFYGWFWVLFYEPLRDIFLIFLVLNAFFTIIYGSFLLSDTFRSLLEDNLRSDFFETF